MANKIYKDVTIAMVGIYNGVNYSRESWEVAIDLFKKDPADVPIAIGHRNFLYNSSHIDQQSAYGYVHNLRLIDEKIPTADLEVFAELEEKLEKGYMRHFSLEGCPINPRRDEKGILQMDGFHLTALAVLGRDRPAVPQAKLASLKDYKNYLTGGGCVVELSEKQDSFSFFSKINLRELKQEETQPLNTIELSQEETNEREELKAIKDKEAILITLKEKEKEMRESFHKKFSFTHRLSQAGILALTSGRITPAEFEGQMQKLETLSELELSEIEKKWRELPVSFSFSTQVDLSDKAKREKEWDDMDDINKQIQLTAKELSINYHEAAKEFYKKHPNARKF